MVRLFSTICGIMLLAGCLAEAQEPPQDLSRYPYARRNRRPPQTNPNDPDPQAVTGQNGYASTPPPAPAPVQGQPAPAPQVPAAAAQPIETAQPENLPPPTPAQVTYRDGLLTVQATNSTLAGLLTAIRNKTGIQFEGLEGATERVVVSIGPAPEAEVLAAILTGSKFDYVVLNRADSPETVQRVLLTPRGGATVAGSPPPLSVRNQGDDEDDEQASTEAEPQDTPVRPPLSQVQPPQPQQNQPTVAPPEQLLERLKQMQEQSQQQQQQPPPQNQGAPVKPQM